MEVGRFLICRRTIKLWIWHKFGNFLVFSSQAQYMNFIHDHKCVSLFHYFKFHWNISNLCQFYSLTVLRHIRKRPTSICYRNRFVTFLAMWLVRDQIARDGTGSSTIFLPIYGSEHIFFIEYIDFIMTEKIWMPKHFKKG